MNEQLKLKIKQILPFKYETVYGENGQWYKTRWRMWFGRCFSIEKWPISNVEAEILKNIDL